MSLINEALKRAEMEKRRQPGDGAGGALPVWPAPGDDLPVSFARGRTGLGGAVLLGAVVIAAVGAGMYFTLPPARKPAPPDRARADLTASAVGVPVTTRPAAPVGTRLRNQAELAAETAMKGTLDALQDDHPPAVKPDDPAGKPAPPTTAPAVAAVHGPENPVAQAPVVTPKTATAPAGPPAPPPAPVADPARFDAGQFQLGGIMESSTGACAIINNHLVAVGDEVNGAKVVIIRKYNVVLEKDGKRLNLRM